MCTAISYRRNNTYFGRNLDLELSFNEKVVITPRNYLFNLKNGKAYRNKFAIIGMASVVNDYPLYYEASNEKGLSLAGLNFPGNAVYLPFKNDKENIAPFEFIPWILGQSESVSQAKTLLENLNLLNVCFAAEIPNSPLHFMLSDKSESIVIEPLEHGIKIYDNPYDVMTNNPPFDYHLWNMQGYLNLSPKNGKNEFSMQYDLQNYAVGMGAIGLPGDYSSLGRFVRAAFNLTNSQNNDTEEDNVTQVFHILDSVSMVKGAVKTDDDKDDVTLYSSCINTDKGIYYYKTYNNSQITAISLNNVDINSNSLFVYDLNKSQAIKFDN